MMATDSLLRALGADPAIFRPLYRLYTLLLRRSKRLIKNRAALTSTRKPQRLICVAALSCGVMATNLILHRAPLLDAAMAITVACACLLTLGLAEDADILVHPAEYLVLAAYPVDDRDRKSVV